MPVLCPTGAEDLRAAEERELKAADKLLLALYRCGKQSSARAAAETAGLGKTTGCDAIKDLITLKLIKKIPGGGIEITKQGQKYVQEQKLEAADGAFSVSQGAVRPQVSEDTVHLTPATEPDHTYTPLGVYVSGARVSGTYKY